MAMENTQNQLPMKVDVKIGSIRPEGSIKAIASVNLNGCFAIRYVKVVDSSKGLFVAMPSYKAGNGEYKDICFPVTKEFREQLNQAVIGAYNQALAQSQNAAPHHEEAPKQNAGMQMGGM
ncbi:septation protein SpoVG family protein [Caproiciproducens sp.]|uniref:septation protein SpoVG family protein n=1 Tax=Caproiciproducens sp. TaxID=1954376 RepID=UPI003FA49D7F